MKQELEIILNTGKPSCYYPGIWQELEKEEPVVNAWEIWEGTTLLDSFESLEEAYDFRQCLIELRNLKK